jgi:hypothetical protein
VRQDDFKTAAEAGAGAEDLAAAVFLDQTRRVESHAATVEIELEQRGIPANVHGHGWRRRLGHGPAAIISAE